MGLRVSRHFYTQYYLWTWGHYVTILMNIQAQMTVSGNSVHRLRGLFRLAAFPVTTLPLQRVGAG